MISAFLFRFFQLFHKKDMAKKRFGHGKNHPLTVSCDVCNIDPLRGSASQFAVAFTSRSPSRRKTFEFVTCLQPLSLEFIGTCSTMFNTDFILFEMLRNRMFIFEETYVSIDWMCATHMVQWLAPLVFSCSKKRKGHSSCTQELPSCSLRHRVQSDSLGPVHSRQAM